MNYKELSKTITYALRHHPEEFGLTLDEQGFVDCCELFAALAKLNKEEWKELSIGDICTIMSGDDKKRFEVAHNKIRAIYGHSIPGICAGKENEPPEILYHGTRADILDMIRNEGLKNMSRCYVHLSSDTVTAKTVGSRRRGETIILSVRAKEAYDDGICFYSSNDTTWMSEPIPADYIDLPKKNFI